MEADTVFGSWFLIFLASQEVYQKIQVVLALKQL
jgi:hypothetical protein